MFWLALHNNNIAKYLSNGRNYNETKFKICKIIAHKIFNMKSYYVKIFFYYTKSYLTGNSTNKNKTKLQFLQMTTKFSRQYFRVLVSTYIQYCQELRQTFPMLHIFL